MDSDDDTAQEEGFNGDYFSPAPASAPATPAFTSTPPSSQGFEDVAQEEEDEEEEIRYPTLPPASAFLREARHSPDSDAGGGEAGGEEPLLQTKAEPAQPRKRQQDAFQPKLSTPVAPSAQQPPPQQQQPKPSLQTRVFDPKVVSEANAPSSSSSPVAPSVNPGAVKKFVAYRIETQVNDPTLSQVQFDGHSTFSVWRRFSDFDWLHNQLEQKYLGFIVPPLPDKTVPLLQNNLSEHFYTTRARALDKFLAHVTSHSVLSRDSSVRDFLIAEQHRFDNLRRGALAHHYGAGGSVNDSLNHSLVGGGGGGGGGAATTPVSSVASGFFEKVLDWGSTLKEQVGTSFAGTAKMGAELRSKSSSDELFDDAVRYVDEMEPRLKLCLDISKSIVTKNTELAKAMHELGLAFVSVGQSEQNAELSRTITELGNVCGGGGNGNGGTGLSVMLATLVAEEEAKFLEPIEDYVRLISAAKHALSIRVKTCTAYEVALGELHYKREAKSRSAMSSSGSTTAVDAKLDQEVGDLERRVESAKSDFDLVTDRVVKEIDRFKREKARDFKALILDYVQLQIAHNVRVEQLWRSLLPRLGGA